MRQFKIAAVIVAIAALTSGAPALADHNGGGPIKQNGLCWKASRGSDQMFGSWRECGEKASLRGGQARGQAQGQAPRQRIGGAKVGSENAAGRSQASKQIGSASTPGRSGAAPPNNRRFEDGEF